MNPTELQPSELMQIAADFFESEGIHYRVVGSMAIFVAACSIIATWRRSSVSDFR